MAAQRDRRPFVPKGAAGNGGPGSAASGSITRAAVSKPAPAKAGGKQASRTKGRSSNQVIPDAVANRMARRIALATGLPTLMGMGVFIGSYVLVSRGILDIPPSATLLASGGCFLLGVLGLSYGVLSASWENEPGSMLGSEQIGVNIERIRSSLRAMRQGTPEA
jgi:hypothetical protein